MKRFLLLTFLLSILAATSRLNAQPYVLPVPGGQGNNSPPSPSGNTLIVAPVVGDPIASGKALTNALAGATAGTTIHVLPGTYTAHNLLKNGVSWYFDPGTTVQWFQHTAETNGPGGADATSGDWWGIFDDRTSGPVTNTQVQGSGDFVYVGPGATNSIIGVFGSPATNPVSAPFMMFNGYFDWRVWSNSVTHTFPLANTLGAVVLTNPLSSFTMSANSISCNQFNFNPLGDTNTATQVNGTGQGQIWDIYVTNCLAAYFNIKELKTWSGSNSIPGDVYGVLFIDNDVSAVGGNVGNYTNIISGTGISTPSGFGGGDGSSGWSASPGAFWWSGGDVHLNCEKLFPMGGSGNNGIWCDVIGTANVNLWANIKDMETYIYDDSSGANYRTWLNFQQCKDTHNGFGGLSLEGNGKVYIQGEKLMHPTNMGPIILLSSAGGVVTTPQGEVWMNIQKIAFDTNAAIGSQSGTLGSAWISASQSASKLYLNCEQFEDTANAIENWGPAGQTVAGLQLSSTNGIHIRGQYALMGSGAVRFLDIGSPKATNIVIEGFHVDGRQSTATNLITLNGNTNLVLRNTYLQCGVPGSMTNAIGSSSASTWVTLQGVYANQTNGLNVLVTNGGTPTMHWP